MTAQRFDVVERHDGTWVLDRETGRRVPLVDELLPRGYAGCIDPASPTYRYHVTRLLNRYAADTLAAYFPATGHSKSV